MPCWIESNTGRLKEAPLRFHLPPPAAAVEINYLIGRYYGYVGWWMGKYLVATIWSWRILVEVVSAPALAHMGGSWVG